MNCGGVDHTNRELERETCAEHNSFVQKVFPRHPCDNSLLDVKRLRRLRIPGIITQAFALSGCDFRAFFHEHTHVIVCGVVVPNAAGTLAPPALSPLAAHSVKQSVAKQRTLVAAVDILPLHDDGLSQQAHVSEGYFQGGFVELRHHRIVSANLGLHLVVLLYLRHTVAGQCRANR